MKNALDNSKAKIMYICNMVTQPGETDNFKVSDHVKILNKYLGKKKIEVLIANNGEISKELAVKYASLEQKEKVECDIENLKNMDVIVDNYVIIDDNRIRYFDITKWVTDTEEQSLDKLVNVYHVLSEEDCNIALIYNRTQKKCQVSIGVVNTNEKQSDPAVADKYYSRMIGAIKGNFPGAEIKGMNLENPDYGIGIPEMLGAIDGECENEQVKSIAIVSNMASEKSEDFISQSMEKLLDGIVPESKDQEYTIVLLAKPVKRQLSSKNRLYELYSALKPFETWQISSGVSENETEGASFTLGSNIGLNIAKSINKNVGVAVPTLAGIANAGIGHSSTVGMNFGMSFQRCSNVAVTVGKNENLIQTYTNYGVKHTLELIENQIKRLEESSALGMWEFAAYIISDSPIVANNVAHMYLALTQGEQSYLSKSAVNFWDGDINTDSAKTILNSVKRLHHPVFGLKTSLNDEWLMYPTMVTPSTILSGKELARSLNFPRKSVSGLPVLEVVSFGREPHSLLESQLDLNIGCAYHMHKKIAEQRISLSKNELQKHVFVTGSTGSGKSNTIYRLLELLNNQSESNSAVNFLVVEPAKGEYKEVLGKNADVTVYGTNPLLSDIQLLHINPFRFPKHVHVLEHLDRLVEIFNVCWPMYAAMPAILKDAMERAYICSGWNLEKSSNKFGIDLYPSFTDVVKQIKLVLNESDYSADNKGDYTGALVTRLKSLTNGINGVIFSVDDIEDDKLFDRNVIVDLSRIGSSETKSLIMGVLVLRLQEYRMEQRFLNRTINNDLKHITVLEEAHNLLKRTSFEQSNEGANLIGKSVEMLANSIAEMRSYGEGFVIVDQSPGLLDMSVIRNTNTKIILRLPDFSDRALVGKAAGLSDNQIAELARLEMGVAAISQSDWLEPVLCKIDEYDGKEWISKKSGANGFEKSEDISTDNDNVEHMLLDYIMNQGIYRKTEHIERLKELVVKSNLDVTIKSDFLNYINAEKDYSVNAFRKLVFDFLDAESAIKQARSCDDISEWVHTVVRNLKVTISSYNPTQIDRVLALIINEQALRDYSYNGVLCRFTDVYKADGGVY